MKLIDQTPYQSPEGEIKLFDRLRGTLQYGFNWYPELEAQKIVVAQFEKALGKTFTLIRNLTLGGSGITVPLILIGPPGIYVLHVTHLRGVYWAKGDAWGTASGTHFQPASINLLTRTASLGRALEVYLKRQGLENLPPVETALIASDPGLHVVSVRPIIRVVMSDAIERFAAGFAQTRPALSPEAVHELADRIVNPRQRQPTAAAPSSQAPGREMPVYIPESLAGSSGEAMQEESIPQSEGAGSFNPDEVGFAFQDERIGEIPPAEAISIPSMRPGRASNRILGMDGKQLVVLGVIAAVEVCVLIGFIFIILFNYS